MADVNKTVDIQVRADMKQLVNEFKKMPNMSGREAKKMVSELNKSFKKAEQAAKKSYEKAAKEAEKSAQKQKKSLKKVENQQDKLQKKTGASFGSIATSAAVAAVAVISLGQRMADLSNELVDTSTKTGVAVDTLTGLRLAAGGAGLSFTELEVGLVKVPQLMLQASQGSKKATKAFDALGVEATRSVDGMMELRSADAVFQDVILSLSKITSGEEKAALAAEVFGKSAGAKFIQSGAIDNLAAFTSLSKEFGQNVGPEMQAEMGRFQRVSATAAEVMQGEFSRLMDVMAGGEAGGGGGIGDIIHGATKGFIVFGEVAGNTMKGLQQSFGAVLAGLNLAMVSVTGTASEVERAQIVFDEIGREIVDHGEKFLDPFGAASERLDRFNELFDKTLQTTKKAEGSGRSSIAQNIVGSKKAVDQLKIANGLLAQMDKNSVKFAEQVIEKRLALLPAEDQITEKRNIALQKLHEEKQALKGNVEAEIERLSALEATAEREEAIHNLQFALEDRLMEMKKQRSTIIREAFDEQAKLSEQQAEQAIGIAEQEQQAHDEEMQRSKERLEALAEEKRKRVELIGTILNQSAEGAVAVSQIIKNVSNENRDAAMIAFRVNQAASIANIAMTTAEKIMEVAPNPFAIAGVAALGALQAGVVASTPAPEFHMGGVIGKGEDTRNITVLDGEAVLSRRAVQSIGGEQGVNSLNRGEAPSRPEPIIMNPFKHFDRYVHANLQRGGYMATIANRKASGGY